jgi:hypothetical protein
MFKWTLFLTGLGFLILTFEWPFPRTGFDNFMILMGYVLFFVPGFVVISLVLNHLANKSFTTNPRRRR